MFYEEDSIAEILKCQHCKQQLDEPRNLPCGNIICNSCVQNLMGSLNKKENSYKCLICHQIHIIQKDGLPINKIVQGFLKKTPTEFYRSELVENFKSNLKYIEKLTIEFENTLTNR